MRKLVETWGRVKANIISNDEDNLTAGGVNSTFIFAFVKILSGKPKTVKE